MTKPMITRLFVGGILALVAGLVLGGIAVVGAFASGSFEMNGPDVVGVHPTSTGWAMFALGIAAAVAIVGGGIAGLVSWIGALLNTIQLDDKSWFVLLLVLGLLSFGWVAMIAYVIAGPDGTLAHPVARAPAVRPT